jgi:surface antigen
MAATMKRPMLRRVLEIAAVVAPLAACAGLSPGDPALYPHLAQSDVALAAQLMQETLESAPDGATRSWTNRETGTRGEITPLRTFVSENGYFCRDYREELAVAGDSGRFYHTACRDDTARWVWL